MYRKILSVWIKSIIVGFVTLFIITCTTTRITSSWKDKLYQTHPKKILVIGVAKKTGKRRVFEDEFVRQLNSHGTNAIASYTILPDDKKDDDQIILTKMKEQGADAILITRLASKKTVHTYIPGNLYYPPAYYGTWRDYYGYGMTSGYVAEDEYAIIETNLYNAGNEKLIWSASSETEIYGSDLSRIKSFIGVMVKRMVKDKLLNE